MCVAFARLAAMDKVVQTICIFCFFFEETFGERRYGYIESHYDQGNVLMIFNF